MGGSTLIEQSRQGDEIEAIRGEIGGLLSNIIVFTDKACADLGTGWKPYEKMDGRFPLGAGETTDTRGDEQSFDLGNIGGSYLHQLTEAEMPKHTHSHEDKYLGHLEK